MLRRIPLDQCHEGARSAEWPLDASFSPQAASPLMSPQKCSLLEHVRVTIIRSAIQSTDSLQQTSPDLGSLTARVIRAEVVGGATQPVACLSTSCLPDQGCVFAVRPSAGVHVWVRPESARRWKQCMGHGGSESWGLLKMSFQFHVPTTFKTREDLLDLKHWTRPRSI